MLRRLLTPALLLTLAACASDGPRDHGPRGGGRHGPGGPDGPDGGPGFRGPPRVKLFISPSGEPFRGDNGLAAWFAGADTNHDGALSPAEFEADAVRFFKVLDTNGDGVLDAFEIQAYERERVPEIAQDTVDEGPPQATRRAGGGGGGRRGGGGGGGRGGGGGDTPGRSSDDITDGMTAQPKQTRSPSAGREGAARYSLLNEPQPVANADENVDGKVTREEWKHATDRRFAHLDKAKTGKLILSDLLLPADSKKKGPRAPGG